VVAGCRTIVVAIANSLFVVALPVCAALPGCEMLGLSWSPGHPGPADLIEVWAPRAPFIPAGGSYASSVAMRGTTITIDAVQTPTVAPFPGYRFVPDVEQQPVAVFGPLPPGTYVVDFQQRHYDATTSATTPGCDVQQTLAVEAEPGPVVLAPVVEFYNAALDHYFMTQDQAEIADLDNGRHAGWMRTGQSFLAYAKGESDARGGPVFRF